MKLSVSAYSFSRIFGKDGFDIYKLIKTVKEQGWDGIEFSGIPGEPNGGDEVFELCGLIKKLCADEELEVVNYCTGSDFLNGSGGDLEKEIECYLGSFIGDLSAIDFWKRNQLAYPILSRLAFYYLHAPASSSIFLWIFNNYIGSHFVCEFIALSNFHQSAVMIPKRKKRKRKNN